MREIMNWALRHHKVDRVFFTIYTARKRGKWYPRYPEAEKKLVQLFSPHLIRVFLARAWPPYDHLQHPHFVCVARFSPSVRDEMLRTEPELARWLNQNGLPEDICLFNSKSTLPSFASSTLSLEGWLIDPVGIKGDFFDSWADTAEVVKRRLQIYDDYAFCRPWYSQRHAGGKYLSKLLGSFRDGKRVKPSSNQKASSR
jgi:hypothetical protein